MGLETKELKDVPIFAAGAWTSSEGKKKEWTEEDLDKIAANAAELEGTLIPFVRIDHTDEKTQKRITGRFKIGDLTNVRRVGEKLIADMIRIPKKVYELMEAGVFGRPSAEIVSNFKDEASGKTYDKVLWGAAVLSAKHPAVTTLDALYDLFGMREGEGSIEVDSYSLPAAARVVEAYSLSTFAYKRQREDGKWVVLEANWEPGAADLVRSVWDTEEEAEQAIQNQLKTFEKKPEGGDAEMNDKEVQAKIDEAVAKAKAEFEAEKKPLEAKVAAFEAKDAEAEKARFESGVASLIEQAKKDGKMIPAQEAGVRAMVAGWVAAAKDGAMEFQSGAEKKSGTVLEAFGAYIEALPVIQKFEESGAERDPAETREEVKVGLPKDLERYARDRGYEVDAESAEKDAKVREVMQKRGFSYAKALSEVEGVEVVVNEPKNTEPPKK